MVMLTLNNGDGLGVFRGKINTNFSTLDADKIESYEVLTRTNTTTFTPTADYHPVTKIYVDNAQTQWQTIYNPTGITGDVFDRSNHIGGISAGDITQDSTSRFVTDVNISNWNDKEDGIGAKGTAFNKNFGTIAGSVSEGDHVHTKSDIGLGDADNTTDVDKPVSTAQQTALDLKANLSLVTNVDNTSDVNKPVSTAQQAALDLKRDSSDSQFGDVSGGDYSEFESDGTLRFNDDAAVWNELTCSLINKQLSSIAGKVYYDWTENSVGFQPTGSISTPADIVNFNHHYPRGAIADGLLKLYLCWEQIDSTDREFTVAYRIQERGAAKTTAWTQVVVTCDSSNAMYNYSSGTLNQKTLLVSVNLTGAGLSPETQFKLARTDVVAGDIMATAANTTVLSDMIGSRTETTK